MIQRYSGWVGFNIFSDTTQKNKFFIKDFFSKSSVLPLEAQILKIYRLGASYGDTLNSMYVRVWMENGECCFPTFPHLSFGKIKLCLEVSNLLRKQKTKNDYKKLKCKKLSVSIIRSVTKNVYEKYIGLLFIFGSYL